MAIFKRVIVYLCCFLVVVAINFWLPRKMSGDPAVLLMAQDGVQVRPELVEQLREKLHLNEPYHVQFAIYIRDLLRGDWGFSYQNNQYVLVMLRSAIGATLKLSIPAVVISSLLAIFLGCLAGYRKNSRLDNVSTSLLIMLYAVPGFLLGMLLLYGFSYKLRLFPLGGMHDVAAPQEGLGRTVDTLYHLVLPVTALTLSSVTSKYLLIRSGVTKERNAKYVVYARSRGLSDRSILFRHIFKNSCQPFISVLGMNVGFILSGSLVIETVFSLNGMGSLVYNATVNRDYVVVQGAFLLLSILVILCNLGADLLAMVIDPRLRKGAYDEI